MVVVELGRCLQHTRAAAEGAASADFGYTRRRERKAEGPKSGPYQRLWNRDGQGRWLVIVDLAHPTR